MPYPWEDEYEQPGPVSLEEEEGLLYKNWVRTGGKGSIEQWRSLGSPLIFRGEVTPSPSDEVIGEKPTDAEYQKVIDLINRYAVVLGLGENFRDLAWARKMGMVNVRGALRGLQTDIGRGGPSFWTTEEETDERVSAEILAVLEAEAGITSPGGNGEAGFPPYPTEDPPEGYVWALNDVNEWAPILDPYYEPPTEPGPAGEYIEDDYGRRAYWTGTTYDHPPDWAVDPDTLETGYVPPTPPISDYQQQMLDLQQQEFEWRKEQDGQLTPWQEEQLRLSRERLAQEQQQFGELSAWQESQIGFEERARELDEQELAWRKEQFGELSAWQEQQLALSREELETEQRQFEELSAWQEAQIGLEQQQFGLEQQQFGELSAWQQAQMGLEQKEQDWRERQFGELSAWQEEQLGLARDELALEQKNYLAGLAAQPHSWLEYSMAAGEQPAIQPWMLPLQSGDYSQFANIGGGTMPLQLPVGQSQTGGGYQMQGIPQDIGMWQGGGLQGIPQAMQMGQGGGLQDISTQSTGYDMERQKAIWLQQGYTPQEIEQWAATRTDPRGGAGAYRYRPRSEWYGGGRAQARYRQGQRGAGGDLASRPTHGGGTQRPFTPTTGTPYLPQTGTQPLLTQGDMGAWQAGQPIPGWAEPGQMPQLVEPSRQYQARMGPTALGQYAGYEQFTTGIRPEELDFRMWSAAPPGGRNPGLTYRR